ncbi:uncharacterized protein YjbJ (UPF0337 family) [Anaerotaenia torta]|uniref:CsbD family protein n=1 Tax=Anaerotaenia torta TaxID=433293 RepID=UPI003D2373F3
MLKEDLKNSKDNFMGKVKETAGQYMDNDRLELKGKLQTMKSKAGNKLEDMKEEMAEKANDILDWADPDKKDKDKQNR